MRETYTIKDLEQVRLLADPLKLRILQAFAEGEKPTKQVASELGESVTKLYRHVDALFDAGLLEISQETPKRGTIERTFRAVARRFEADQSLFGDEMGGDGLAAVRDVLRAGEEEVLGALEAVSGEEELEDIILMRLRCKAKPERIAELRDSLSAWIESVEQSECESTDDGGSSEEVGALIAFYPVKQ